MYVWFVWVVWIIRVIWVIYVVCSKQIGVEEDCIAPLFRENQNSKLKAPNSES